MTKQEEIREGIKEILLPSGKESVITPYMSGIVSQLIMEYLHSQGVVIKVERELPDCPGRVVADPEHLMLYKQMQEGFIKAGYAIAVEPLVKMG